METKTKQKEFEYVLIDSVGRNTEKTICAANIKEAYKAARRHGINVGYGKLVRNCYRGLGYRL
jgi:hypothetical protein